MVRIAISQATDIPTRRALIRCAPPWPGSRRRRPRQSCRAGDTRSRRPPSRPPEGPAASQSRQAGAAITAWPGGQSFQNLETLGRERLDFITMIKSDLDLRSAPRRPQGSHSIERVGTRKSERVCALSLMLRPSCASFCWRWPPRASFWPAIAGPGVGIVPKRGHERADGRSRERIKR
jgi:hypothetical protein